MRSQSIHNIGQHQRKNAAVCLHTCTMISLSWLTSPKSRHRLLRRLYSPSPRVPAIAMSIPSGLMDACVRGYRAAMYCWGTRMCCTPSWGAAGCWDSLRSGPNRLLGLPVAASLTTNSLSSAYKQPSIGLLAYFVECRMPDECLQVMPRQTWNSQQRPAIM